MDIIPRPFSDFFIFILCVSAILFFIVLLILIIPMIIYNYIKTKIYRHTFFIPANTKLYDEIQKWLSENIHGPVWVVDVTDEEREDWHGHSMSPSGWSVRFIKKTDAMAFKLVWIGII